MPSWKKIISSGSNAHVNSLTASSGVQLSGSVGISGLSSQGSEQTALMINGSNTVGYRELGTLAFQDETSLNQTLTFGNYISSSQTSFNGSQAVIFNVNPTALQKDISGSIVGAATANTSLVYFSSTGAPTRLDTGGSGNSGQVLKIASDGSVEWATHEGDISGVHSGIGLSGGGTTGAITMSLSLSELAEGTPSLSGDHFVYVPAGTSGSAATSGSKVSIADFVSSIAGTGLTATNGILSSSLGELGTSVDTMGVSDSFVIQDASGQTERITLETLIEETAGDGLYYSGAGNFAISASHIQGFGIKVDDGTKRNLQVDTSEIAGNGLSGGSDGSTPLTVTPDPGGGITVNSDGVSVASASINIEHLSGYSANEHIDHSTVSIATAAASGLQGGGTIAATRNLEVKTHTGIAKNSSGIYIGQDVGTSANVTFNNVTVDGTLLVAGGAAEISYDRLAVADQFIFIASGSAAANVDGGIFVQSGSTPGTGSALYHDVSNESGRWCIAQNYDSSSLNPTPSHYLGTIQTGSGVPNQGDHNGNAVTGSVGNGEMWLNTDDNSIWIRTG